MKRLGTARPRAEAADAPDIAPWRFERRVPPTLLLTAAVQCAALVAWGAYLEARVTTLERTQPAYVVLSEKFARLEERIDALRGDIAELRKR